MLPASHRPALTDPSFPHLRVALDPASMLEVFKRHLRPRGERAHEIRGCRLSRIRYREGFRCVLQYTLRIVEPATGSERDLLVSGTMYADEAEARQRWLKLREKIPDSGVPVQLLTFDSASFIPRLGMLVQVFPFDRRLPTLPLLAAGPPPEIEDRLLARLGPGVWRAEAWATEPVRYREHLGAVFRYDVRARDATGEPATGSFYAKVYRNDAGGRTFRALQRLRETCRAEDYTVGVPVAYRPELRTLFLDAAPGVPLEGILLRGTGTTEAMRQIARHIASFNQLDVVPERRYSLADYVSSLERSAGLLGWASPDLTAEVNGTVAAIADGLKEVPPRPTHRDLKTDHIFLHGARTVFIDLDSFAAADPVLDPALLLARLAAMPDLLPVPESRARAAARAFADEYFARVPASWRERLHLHYAGALLEVAHGFFRRQEADWRTNVSRLVREAADSLQREIR